MWFMKLRPWPVRIQTAALSLSLAAAAAAAPGNVEPV